MKVADVCDGPGRRRGSRRRAEAMSGRRWLVRAFPRSWRVRFGDQLGHLLDDIEEESGKIRAGDQLDVARAGLTERLGELRRHRQAILGGGVALFVAVAAALTALQFTGVPASQIVRPPAPASSTTHPERSHPTAFSHTTPIQTAQKNAAAAEAAAHAAVRAQVAAQAAAAARAAARAAAQVAALESGMQLQAAVAAQAAAEAVQAAETARAQGADTAPAQAAAQVVAVSATAQ